MEDDKAFAFGKDIRICDWITILNPKISDLVDIGLKKHWNLVKFIISEPNNCRNIFAKVLFRGLDYPRHEYFFTYIVPRLKNKSTSMVFMDLDLSAFRLVKHTATGKYMLYQPGAEQIIDETIYNQIVKALEKMYGLGKDDRAIGLEQELIDRISNNSSDFSSLNVSCLTDIVRCAMIGLKKMEGNKCLTK